MHKNLREWLLERLPVSLKMRLEKRKRCLLPLKGWAAASLSLVALALVSCMLLVYLVDPFQHYRIATFYKPHFSQLDQAHLNAGLSKHDDYNALILGSSMTENTPVARFNSLFDVDAAKLSVMGGRFENNRLLLNNAYDSGHDLRIVFIGVDHFSINEALGATEMDVPDHFYSDWGIWDDAPYLLSRYVLASHVTRSLLSFVRGERFSGIDYDTIFRFGDDREYGREAVLREANFIQGNPIAREGDQAVIDAQIESCFAPFIEAHPETTFILYFPPYSVAEWHRLYAEGTLGRILFHKEYFTEKLLQYDNVKIYDPQSDAEIITNLDNYFDLLHSGSWINDLLIDRIAQDEYRITSLDDLQANNARIEELAAAFIP